jgi:Tfp pilus assembly protein FimT
MLVVLAIIAIISAIAVPLIPSLLKSDTLDSNVQTLSGILEQARETAISGNTFVWVAFTDPPAGSPRSGSCVAVFQSQDGTDPINFTNALVVPGTVTNTTTSLVMVGRLQTLPGSAIADPSGLPAAIANLGNSIGVTNPATLTATNSTGLPLQWTVTPYANTEGYSSTNPYFKRAIEFTPDGEAHTLAWNPNISFGLTNSISTSTNNLVLVNISRLTGRTTILRP